MNPFISKYGIWYPAFFLRGQKVWRAIRQFKETPYHDPHQIREWQFEKFRQMIFFAYHHIPFYQSKYDQAGIRPEDIRTPEDIHKIPILTKQEIIDKPDKIYYPEYSGKRFRRSTSGSTGIPLVFYKDALSMTMMDAILYRNYSWFGIDIGERQARFWGHPLNRTGFLKTRLTDRILNRTRFSPFRLEGEYYHIYLKKIEKFKAQYICGYAQSVFQFSRYFYEKKTDLSYLKLKAVILTGEMIFPHQIRVIKEVFSCDVTEEYGCTELGVIGFKCEHGTMHLMENLLTESAFIASDNTSENIIVSELYGELFPLIRYQIGDKGKVSHEACPCGRKLAILENMSGRKDDFIRCPDGKLSDPYVLEYIVNDIPIEYGKIRQFRVIQKQTDLLEIYLVSASEHGNIGKEKIRNYILHAFSKNLSSDMKIDIHFADSLEKEKSGKLRCFVSELGRTG